MYLFEALMVALEEESHYDHVNQRFTYCHVEQMPLCLL